MTNEEHLRILKQGMSSWMQWRTDNPGIRPNLRQANLRGADLTEAWLQGADLGMADLGEANLTGARLTGAILNKANLSKADLRAADLSFAYVIRVHLDKANISNAIVGWTTFGDVDLSEIVGLETVRHYGPSTIGIDTIYRSRGKIPEIFLRGAGVPEDFITYAASLVGKPIQFYSCFISYSSKDQAVAERLRADLQSKGIRCWFAPEDMKIGDRIRPRIDEAIRLYDKLLLILSQHSIESYWVADEVEAALEKERRQGGTVLFPITLDDAVWDTDQAWAAKIRRECNMGDFRRWKDHDAYQKAFERLLRDLEVEDVRAGT